MYEENLEKIEYGLYARKSSSGDERQIQSLDIQNKDLLLLAERFNLNIKQKYSEQKSAKDPNQREVFNKMLDDVESGKINGILAWNFDRLSRNPVDTARLNWLLQKGVIKSIKMIDKEFRSEDSTLLMSIDGAVGNDFIINLRKKSIAGTRAKAEAGWLPSRAPLGYINSGEVQGGKYISIDKERFNLVRKMWDMVLDGDRLSDIVRLVTEDWGLRNRKLRKSGGSIVSKSQVYAMFSNIFYTGKFSYGGKIYQGKHQAMITMEEFEKVQNILKRKDKPRPSKNTFSYTGIIKCGCGCGNMITAYEKKEKYIYYTSTKKNKIHKCSQKQITEIDLKKQIIERLGEVEIKQSMLDWAFDIIDANVKKDKINKKDILKAKENSILDKEKDLENLKHMRMKDFIDDEEFIRDKNKIEKDISLLKKNNDLDKKTDEKAEKLKNSLVFVSEAKKRLLDSRRPEEANKIMRYFGHSHYLLDKKFSFEVEDWLKPVLANYKKAEKECERLELDKTLTKQGKNKAFDLVCSDWGGYWESNSDSRYHKPK